MRNYLDDNHEFISTLESLPAYLRTIKSGRTQFVNGVTYLQTRLNTLKKFKGRTELYSSEVFDYYNPFSEIQETVIASFVAPGLIRSAPFSMSADQAKKKSDLLNMIKTPMRFLEELHHQSYTQQIEDENFEWMTAEDVDFESIYPNLKHLRK